MKHFHRESDLAEFYVYDDDGNYLSDSSVVRRKDGSEDRICSATIYRDNPNAGYYIQGEQGTYRAFMHRQQETEPIFVVRDLRWIDG